MCQLEYVEQPPDQLTCNPYLNMELKLECTVSLLSESQLQTGKQLVVYWYHSPSVRRDPQTTTSSPLAITRLDDAQNNVSIREQMMLVGSDVRLRSQLEVGLRLDSLDGVGKYWCGVRSESIEWMVLSDPLQLQGPAEYEDFPSCRTTRAQSKKERKCASWSFKPSTPMATALPVSPPTSLNCHH